MWCEVEPSMKPPPWTSSKTDELWREVPYLYHVDVRVIARTFQSLVQTERTESWRSLHIIRPSMVRCSSRRACGRKG